MSQPSNQLALAIPRTHAQYDSRALPFRFTQDNSVTTPKKHRAKPALMMDVVQGRTKHRSGDLSIGYQQRHRTHELGIEVQTVRTIATCHTQFSQKLQLLNSSLYDAWTAVKQLTHCNRAWQSLLKQQNHCVTQHNGISVLLKHNTTTIQTATQLLQAATNTRYTTTDLLTQQTKGSWQGKPIARSFIHQYSHAVPVPCEWYTIEIPHVPPPLPKRCISVHGNRIPFALGGRQIEHSSKQIPFAFACHRPKVVVPLLESYIMLNKITAYSGSLKLNPISISLQSDMTGFYWMVDITLPSDDFAALNLAQYNQGSEPLISININDDVYTFIAEGYRDNRQFGNKTYTVSGRSQVARLGADYAQLKQGIITQDLYARQIADSVLADTGYRIGSWSIPDWLVPANVYSLTDKTPIAVLADIAQTAGGFVESHPSERIINIKKCYPCPAWQLSEAQADVAIPDNVITQISGQKQVSTQCYGVFVSATHSKGVFRKIVRKASVGSPEASALSHALYTDDNVCQAAGIAALSATGASKIEQIELPIMAKYGLERARLGDIWQVAEPSGAWKGIVNNVSVSITTEDGAPKIMQSVGLFRYLGE